MSLRVRERSIPCQRRCQRSWYPLRALFAAALTLVSSATSLAVVDGCDRRTPNERADGKPPMTSTSMKLDTDGHPTVAVTASASAAPPSPDAACAVAFVSWAGGGGPNAGDDVSAVGPAWSIPAGASVTIAVRRTGHQVLFKGPAVVRPCTHAEPDVILVASGEASVDATVPTRPGAELFVATPSFVAIFARATLTITASGGSSTWDLTQGDAMITTLDVPKPSSAKDKGSLRRFEDGGILLTRCGVQTAAASSAERMLLSFQSTGPSSPSDAAPLPSASIGILTAQHIKHARERVLDCAFAQAFGMSCDVLRAEGSAPPSTGCGTAGNPISLARVRDHMAHSLSPAPIPPGSPPLRDAGPTAPVDAAP